MTFIFDKNDNLKLAKKPIWLMRQAGRYLPEYLETRKQAGDFVSLCLNPQLACEVTLQPIRRFGFDASIIFSDILMIPFGLGQDLWFETGEGPRLGELSWSQELDLEKLDPIYQAITLTRDNLPQNTPLIGFAGAPWTLLLYALQCRGGSDFIPARQIIYKDPKRALSLIKILEKAIITHLSEQIKAGCQMVQIFDSWAGLCPSTLQHNFLLNPVKNIITTLKTLHPDTPIIAFPKGFSNLNHYQDFVSCDIIGVDQFTPLTDLDNNRFIQGNLDPLALIAGGDILKKAVDTILEKTEGRPHIFNLGHGIDKTTPIKHVEELLKMVQG